MRVKTLILVAAFVAGFYLSGCARFDSSARAALPATAQTKVDFNTQLKPIFESRCTPCHFAGGTVYERLPFDRSETIKKLGTKLFTRIKDEKEQRLIQEFLAQ
ncbi:MAG TPA: hypothetical protein VF779_10610 [Pyrinomonadaceae bacterium]